MATLSKVREELAQTFLDALNQGQLPWRKCWSQALPVNAVTGKTYRGINTLVLSWYGDHRSYTDTRWCTYNQAQEKGWQVRKGSKGVKVEYWACYDTKEKKLLSWDDVRRKLKADPDYEKNLQLRCRTYTVFNGEQIDGIPAPTQQPSTDIGTLRDKRDTLIRNMGIGYQEGGIRAYYSPGMDTVTLPPEATFDDTYSYMATFLHECGHASGHESRLNRDLTGGFGSESYAREELRAEIASAFTAQSLGLQLTDEQLQYQTEQHTAYIQGWSKILQDSPEELFRAIKDAEAISDYLIEKGDFNMEQLFKAETVQQRKIMEWLVDQGITGNDIAGVQLTGPAMVRLTNPAGQYMDVYCSEDYAVRILNVSEEREAELQDNFWNETNEPEDQEWREELTADEAAMVEQWDLQTAKGFSRLATEILGRNAPPEQIMVAIESTDDYTDANFHSELIDLDKQNRDGSWGTVVDHYRLVKIGDSGRIESLDRDLVFDTRAQAEAAATSIPYAQLVDYDTLVHEAGKSLTAKYTIEELSPGSYDLRLRFHGHGKIEGYSFPEARPWQAQINRIREVVIEKGITEIGRNVLNDYPALEKLTRPKSLQQTDPHILRSCPMLKEIKYTGTKSEPSVTSPHELMELAEKYPGFKVEQLQEISAGIHDGLTAEQIAYYARPEFGSVQMNALRYCATSGLTPEQLAVIANPAFGAVQMDVIRSSFQSGMTMEQVSSIAQPELTPNQMLDRYWEIRNAPTRVQLPEKLSLEEFLGRRGLASPVDDYMMDKHRLPHGETQRQQAQRQRDAQASSEAYHASREQAISEYKELLSQGKIVQPSDIDQKLITARGRSENEAVQAARRSLEKRGIDWITGGTLAAPSQDMIEAVHHWESRNLALMPEDLSTTVALESGKVTVRPGQCSLLKKRYQEQCSPSSEQHITPEVQHRPDDPLFQAEREFWEMDDFLKKGGDIAELADWYEQDLSPDWD